jgi:hypothetical protein
MRPIVARKPDFDRWGDPPTAGSPLARATFHNCSEPEKSPLGKSAYESSVLHAVGDRRLRAIATGAVRDVVRGRGESGSVRQDIARRCQHARQRSGTDSIAPPPSPTIFFLLLVRNRRRRFADRAVEFTGSPDPPWCRGYLPVRSCAASGDHAILIGQCRHPGSGSGKVESGGRCGSADSPQERSRPG